MARASLEPGKDNIDSRKVVRAKDGIYRLQWSVCLLDGTVKKCTSKGTSKQQVRRRAHEKAEQLLISHGDKTSWKSSDNISDFITRVSIPDVDVDPKLRPRTRKLYARQLGYLADEFKGMTIANAARPKVIAAALDSIAKAHGTSTATQTRKVANRVMQKLIFEEALAHNPLSDTRVPITRQVKKAGPAAKVEGLTKDEYERAYAYVLAADPADPERTRGRGYKQADRTRKRATYIDITILQAATGLRISEICNLTRDSVTIDGDTVTLNVTPADSKTHKGRRVPILLNESAQRFIARVNALDPSATYIFHTPTNPLTQYNITNADKAVNKFLHDEVAEECDIPSLSIKGVGNHIWRKTLNNFAKYQGLSKEYRASYFGHSEDVNEQYYTDDVEVAPFVETMSSFLNNVGA